MHSTKYGVWALTVSFAFAGLMAASGMAAASPLQDIPEGFANWLETDAYVAEAILSTLVLVSVALALAVLKMSPQGVIITLIVVLGMLTAVGWMDTWVIVLVGVLVAALFARSLISGQTFFSSGGDE